MFEKWPVPSLTLIAATPGSGKTHFINWLLYTFQNYFDYGYIFTSSKYDNEYPCVPDKFVKNNFNLEYLQGILDRQKELIEEVRTGENKEKKAEPHMFIILDDCLGFRGFNSSTFDSLVSEYRHLNCTMVISVQYVQKIITPTIRNCLNYVIIFKQFQKLAIKGLYENFGYVFDTLNEFRKFIDEETSEKFWFIVVDLKNQSAQNKMQSFAVHKLPPNKPNFKFEFE